MNEYEENRLEIAEKMSAEERLTNIWEWPDITGVASDNVDAYLTLKNEGDDIYDKGVNYGIILLLIVALFVAINFFVYRKHEEKVRIMGFVMLLSAASFLYLGLKTPFLEIEAFKDDVEVKIPISEKLSPITDFFGMDNELAMDVEGRVYFMYQNKSVLQLIKMLYTGGNIPVALIILLFSIIFPVVKLTTSVVLLLSPGSSYADSAVRVINKLGKWSMADVMVASIFLAYFSFSNMNVGVDTGASTLVGLYFFTAFVVLSIFSGSYIKKYINSRKGEIQEA